MIGWLFGRLLERRLGPANSNARLVAFARGLALGALVGAAITGSSVWRKRQG